MITISKRITGDIVEPARSLTLSEEKIVIARWGDEENYWFFTQQDKDQNTSEWQQYVSYMSAVESSIDVEYQRYVKRKTDGERAFLMLMSELRLYAIANNQDRSVNRDIENRLEEVKSQVIEGQWISALEKLEEVEVAGALTQELYDRIHLALTTYIAENY